MGLMYAVAAATAVDAVVGINNKRHFVNVGIAVAAHVRC